MEKKSKPIIIVGILVVLAMLGVLIASIASKAKSEGGVNHGKSLETLEKKVKINGEKKFFARPGTIKDQVCVKITDVYDEMHELLRNYF